MISKKNSDYGSYLASLKNSSKDDCLVKNHIDILFTQYTAETTQNYEMLSNKLNTLSNKLNTLSNKINNEYLHQSEHIYTSTSNNVSIDMLQSFIYQDINDITLQTTNLNLLANSSIDDGLQKRIINVSHLLQNSSIKIKSFNTDRNSGGFYNLGQKYNCYICPITGDTLELIWSKINYSWITLQYGGYFTNN